MERHNRRCQFSKAERGNKDYIIGKEVFAPSLRRGPRVKESSKKITFVQYAEMLKALRC